MTFVHAQTFTGRAGEFAKQFDGRQFNQGLDCPRNLLRLNEKSKLTQNLCFDTLPINPTILTFFNKTMELREVTLGSNSMVWVLVAKSMPRTAAENRRFVVADGAKEAPHLTPVGQVVVHLAMEPRMLKSGLKVYTRLLVPTRSTSSPSDDPNQT